MTMWIKKGIAFHNYPDAGILLDVKGRRYIRLNSASAKVIERVIKEKNLVEWFMDEFSVDKKTALREIKGLLGMLQREGFLTEDSSEKANISTNQQEPSLSCVTLRITDECNMKCKHCFLGDGKGKNLPLSIIKDLLQSLHEYRVMIISVTGGEPFLHPHILEILRLINDYGIPFRVCTNGTLISPDIIDALKNFPSFIHLY